MKKFIFTALLGASALAFAAGAHAEGKAAIESDTQTNTDTSAAGSPDNSYAHGDVNVNENGVSAISTTGTKDGTASGSIVRDNSANGIDAEGKVGRKDGDDDKPGSVGASAKMSAGDNDAAEDRAELNQDMTSKTGIMKTRAKGAMGMLNPDEIKQVQQNLQQAGYSVQVDGVWGKGTRAALKEYQKSKNLNVTGKMDADTRSSMGMKSHY